MDYLIKMAFSFSAPACTCCFVSSRELFQFISPKIKTTTQSEINPQDYLWIPRANQTRSGTESSTTGSFHH